MGYLSGQRPPRTEEEDAIFGNSMVEFRPIISAGRRFFRTMFDVCQVPAPLLLTRGVVLEGSRRGVCVLQRGTYMYFLGFGIREQPAALCLEIFRYILRHRLPPAPLRFWLKNIMRVISLHQRQAYFQESLPGIGSFLVRES